MTTTSKTAINEPRQAGTSTLPFDPETLGQGIRVRPAQFARMCEVSKQAVSQWIANGKISLYPDGTLDPARAARELINNTDPLRIRAKVFKAVSDDARVLRQRIAELAEELDQANDRINYLEQFNDESNAAEEIFRAMLLQNLDLIRKEDLDGFARMLDQLFDDALIAAGGEVGTIDPDTDEPAEPVDGPWRKYFIDGMAYRGNPSTPCTGALADSKRGAGIIEPDAVGVDD